MKYGFQKHLSEKFPSQIIVDLTEYCNLACIHCPHPKFSNSSHFSGTHLDVDLHKKLIDEVAMDGEGSCQYIRYTSNGETLLHPEFSKIISYAGEFSKTKLNVTTNGHFLDEDIIDTLIRAKVDVVDISLDAFSPATYEKIRVNGNLYQVTENILLLMKKIRHYNQSTKVLVSFVEQPLNIDEAERFREYWTKMGADFVVMRKLHSSAGYKKGIQKKLLETARENRKPCLYPWERLSLSPTGFLAFCPADWEHGSHFYDFRKITIKEAWNSEFMIRLRRAHLENHFEEFPFCEKCPDWINTKWPEEGTSYFDVMKTLLPSDLLEEE